MAESRRGADARSQGIPGSAAIPNPPRAPGTHPGIRDFGNRRDRSRNRALLLLLLGLGCLGCGGLGATAIKKQAEMRAELELLRSNSSGSWAQAWQELQQTRSEVQRLQLELRSITELLCRTIEDSHKCPPGWEFFGSSCFFFSGSARSWRGAGSACAAFGSHLAVLSTEGEQVFLMSKIQGNNSYWLGVTDEQHEGKWAWVTGETPNFGFWDVWEEDPDKEHKDCGAMKPNGRWINERCSKLNRWICEKSWDC